ncbi:MAG: hypothetical protein HY927_02865 [Elusimicrobia bacterium]|nr:hypothetical protein [Elusimicrobiota bacterium]
MVPRRQREILETLQKNRVELRQLGVRRLGLFGSRASGRALKPRLRLAILSQAVYAQGL